MVNHPFFFYISLPCKIVNCEFPENNWDMIFHHSPLVRTATERHKITQECFCSPLFASGMISSTLQTTESQTIFKKPPESSLFHEQLHPANDYNYNSMLSLLLHLCSHYSLIPPCSSLCYSQLCLFRTMSLR